MLFLDNLAVILGSLTLQDKYNIRTLSENMKFICNRLFQERKADQKARFSTCFK